MWLASQALEGEVEASERLRQAAEAAADELGQAKDEADRLAEELRLARLEQQVRCMVRVGEV